MKAHPLPRSRKWQLTRPQAFLLVAVFTDVNFLGILHLLHFYDLYSAQNGGELLSDTCDMVLRIFYSVIICIM